jgi:hypothetical protein
MKSIYEQYRVTPEQVDLCQRYIDEATNTVFYLVPSASEAGLYYKVEWNRDFGRFSCQCRANREGMSCWHCRAVVVHATQDANAIRAEAEAAERMREEEAERERVQNARPYRPSTKAVRRDQERCQSQGFSLLR